MQCKVVHDIPNSFMSFAKSFDGPKMDHLHEPWQSAGIYSFITVECFGSEIIIFHIGTILYGGIYMPDSVLMSHSFYAIGEICEHLYRFGLKMGYSLKSNYCLVFKVRNVHFLKCQWERNWDVFKIIKRGCIFFYEFKSLLEC